MYVSREVRVSRGSWAVEGVTGGWPGSRCTMPSSERPPLHPLDMHFAPEHPRLSRHVAVPHELLPLAPRFYHILCRLSLCSYCPRALPARARTPTLPGPSATVYVSNFPGYLARRVPENTFHGSCAAGLSLASSTDGNGSADGRSLRSPWEQVLLARFSDIAIDGVRDLFRLESVFESNYSKGAVIRNCEMEILFRNEKFGFRRLECEEWSSVW